VSACALCGVGAAQGDAPSLTPLVRDIKDYEYGVPWRSELWACGRCGLVVQQPRIAPADVSRLYPRSYLAHSGSSRARGVYGRLKNILARREAGQLARHVPQNGRIIEVGCGNGKFLSVLHDVRPDIGLAGVDIEDVGIADLPGLTFHHGQLEEVDIEPSSFDAVYCSNLVEHVPDPLAFLTKCRKILKPGGVIVGITPDHLSLDRYIFGRYWAGYHYPRHTFVFDHRNIRTVLENAGFEVVGIKGSHAYWYLSLANLMLELPGTRKRGLAFAAITVLFAPLDLLINCFRAHGSMAFVGRRVAQS
jgi:SAM-dependent methyltransferase